MKKIMTTTLKCIVFFLGWAILCTIFPLSTSNNPAIWRLWAEITPLIAIIAFTIIFWLIEKKTIRLNLLHNPVNGMLIGTVCGIVWLSTVVIIMLFINVIHFDNKNDIPLIYIWIFATFLNVVMQELLVRGYLYQMLKQNYNVIIATIITTMLFTALHGGAFEVGIIPVINVFSMSILMTIILEYTGSLIAPTIMHFIWNSFGGVILGGVSLAEDYPHLMNMTFSGNIILSGGECKLEGSIITLIINILLIVFFYIMNDRKQKLERI